ncbi:unnamed protein product [Owenia fusiformis]|uniref:Uncharacterized protein n=1 Tax=Owenia fusiformis TaxID=6347 RepID=A0A8J1Y863_OWEFU|nr:unnamed protein product [Owenia fusiformis]
MNCGKELENITHQSTQATGDPYAYKQIQYVVYRFGLPLVCGFGFLGNVLNLIILTGKRIQRSLKNMERSANICLIALAFADAMFCLCAFPTTFLPHDNSFENKGFMLYYGIYSAAIINIFIMISTWLTVNLATERYLAICHPLKSRKIITLGRTKFAITSVFIVSILFNLPVFWRYAIISDTDDPCVNGTNYRMVQMVIGSTKFDHAYRAVWAIFGNFMPLVMLIFFNACLMRKIHQSKINRKRLAANAQRETSSESESSNRVTLTLVAIVVMFCVLVAPSEIIKHLAYIIANNLDENYTYLTIEVVTNLMQTINFSANFILYCIINRSFRRTMKHMFCGLCTRDKNKLHRMTSVTSSYSMIRTQSSAYKYGSRSNSPRRNSQKQFIMNINLKAQNRPQTYIKVSNGENWKDESNSHL